MSCYFFFFQAEDGIRDSSVTGVQTCALPIYSDVSRHGREVLLRHVAAAAGRRVPEDQRRTADAVSAGVLSLAAIFGFGIPSTAGGPDESAGGSSLSVSLPGGVLHAEGDVLRLRQLRSPRPLMSDGEFAEHLIRT